MGSIGGLLGTAGGAGGSGFSSPQTANLTNPTNQQQITDAYGNVQGAMGNQTALLQALQAQNGLQNQSNTFNAMQGTANQYQNIANGAGPNPAQNALNQATGQNVSNQAALMAGQRGSSSNAGLIARQAAQQGAATQQQAVGQGATLQAQQQMNALSGLSSQQANMANVANTQASNQIGQTNANTAAQQAEQTALINAQLGYNNNQVGMQSNVNNVNGQLANTTMQGAQGLLGGVMNGIGSMFAEGGDVDEGDAPASASGSGASGNDFAQNTQEVSPGNTPSGSTPSFGSDAGAAAFSKSGGGGGGSGGGLGSMLGLAAMAAARGGEVRHFDNGGAVGEMADEPTIGQKPSNGPMSRFGKFMQSKVKAGAAQNTGAMDSGTNSGATALQAGAGSLISGIGHWMMSPSAPQTQTMAGGPMDNGGPAMDDTMMAARGGMTRDFRGGGKVQAKNAKEKAVKSGNSYANDKIPAVLSEHEIVIPRSITMGKDPVRNSADFVAKVLAKRQARK